MTIVSRASRLSIGLQTPRLARETEPAKATRDQKSWSVKMTIQASVRKPSRHPQGSMRQSWRPEVCRYESKTRNSTAPRDHHINMGTSPVDPSTSRVMTGSTCSPSTRITVSSSRKVTRANSTKTQILPRHFWACQEDRSSSQIVARCSCFPARIQWSASGTRSITARSLKLRSKKNKWSKFKRIQYSPRFNRKLHLMMIRVPTSCLRRACSGSRRLCPNSILPWMWQTDSPVAQLTSQMTSKRSSRSHSAQ